MGRREKISDVSGARVSTFPQGKAMYDILAPPCDPPGELEVGVRGRGKRARLGFASRDVRGASEQAGSSRRAGLSAAAGVDGSKAG